LEGSILDGDPSTFVVTFDNQPQAEAWFTAGAGQPVIFSRIVFAHGRSFHDGGWFDASGGKPKIQIQTTPNGPWETVGELAAYPATTATSNGALKDGDAFTLKLTEPVKAVALRVIGKPACGDNPKQAFASCSELQVFTE
jgi:hypothetical protein